MGYPESAIDAYEIMSERLGNLGENAFFRENPDLVCLAEAAEAVAKFVIDRPVMAVGNWMSAGLLLELLSNELSEALEAKQSGDDDGLKLELGDATHFALTIGMMHWKELSDEEQEFLVDSIKCVSGVAEKEDIDVVEQVIYVASKKDPVNYPEEFYQIRNDEKTVNMPRKMRKLAKLSRQVRKELNGKWLGGDLVMKMTEFGKNGARPEQVDAIDKLLIMANLGVCEMV